MIYDHIDRIGLYRFGAAAMKACDFLKTLTPDTPEETFELDGRDVYVMVQSESSYDMVSAMLGGDSGEGMKYIGEYADQGMVMPNYSVIQYEEPIATVAKSGPLLPGLLYWTDNWKERVSPSLEELYGEILKDENIAYVDGPFDWDQMLEELKEKGITDTYAKLQYVRENISAKAGLVFNQVVDQMASFGEPECLFSGPGLIITNNLKKMGFDYDWIAMVEEAKETGLTDPTEIIAYGIYDFGQKYPEYSDEIGKVVSLIRNIGITDDMIVNSGFSPLIDYIMNVLPSTVGGDYTKGGKNVTHIIVLSATVEPAMSHRSMQSISHTSDCVGDYLKSNSDFVTDKWDTGSAVVMYEVAEGVQSQFIMIEILVIVFIIVLLLVVMRSYLIPLRSALTILMSISWTLALMHLIFVDVLGGEILWLAPITLLVICLGLGMDYDILLTTRIRENVIKGMSNDDAIRTAVVKTGSVITICGLIMGGAFGTLMISSMSLLQQFGFSLCVAILLDALVVRTYVVPALMHLLGDWSWKGPGSRVLRKEENTEE